MTARPEFFIAGAAKCGTTAVAEYLAAHASVFIPRIKEPNFFCTDLKPTSGVRTLKEYASLFAAAPEGCLSGEASALYLYSGVAIQRAMEHNPRAKVITMLRYPVDAAHSLHASRWNHGHENIGNFEDAWRLQTVRLAGFHMPPGWPDPATLQYGAIYRYAAQVRRVMEYVPERQRLFLVFEEFFADPRSHYGRVLEFLTLTPGKPILFPIVNSATGPRSHRLDQLLREPPRWLSTLYRPMRPLLRAAGFSPASAARSLNSAVRPKVPLRPAFRAELDRFFADDVAELERLLQRPLWRETAPMRDGATN